MENIVFQKRRQSESDYENEIPNEEHNEEIKNILSGRNSSTIL